MGFNSNDQKQSIFHAAFSLTSLKWLIRLAFLLSSSQSATPLPFSISKVSSSFITGSGTSSKICWSTLNFYFQKQNLPLLVLPLKICFCKKFEFSNCLKDRLWIYKFWIIPMSLYWVPLRTLGRLQSSQSDWILGERTIYFRSFGSEIDRV